MPVCGVPLSQVMLEHLARNRFTRVVLVLSEGSYLMERHFGGGRRWGLEIRYVLERGFVGVRESLIKALSFLEGPFLLYEQLVMTDVPAAELFEAHQAAGKGLTVANPASADDRFAAPRLFVLEKDRIAGLPEKHEGIADYAAGLPGEEAHFLRLDNAALAVRDLPSYVFADRAALAGKPPFARNPERIRIGRGCGVHPSAVLSPPVYIGDFTTIGKSCVIGPETTINSGCVVDDDAEIVRGIVLKNTYVGEATTLNDRIADNDLLVDPETGTVIRVPDVFVLGNSYGGHGLSAYAARLTQRILAFLALIPALAFLAPLALRLSPRRPGKMFITRRVAGKFIQTDLTGAKNPEHFSMHLFDVDNFFLRRLPALWDVARGKLSVVGPEPLSPEEAEAWLGSWANERFTCRPGLIGPWRGQGINHPDEMEKRVMENHYAQTRTPLSALFILAGALGLRRRAKALRNLLRKGMSQGNAEGERRRGTP